MRNLFLLHLFPLLTVSATLLAQENLVKNPGFEESANDKGQPGGGWWLYTGNGEPELKLDAAVAHGGKASARVRAGEDAKCTVVSAPFAVASGDELRFGAWVRGEKLPAGKERTYCGIAFRTADGRVFERKYVPAESVSGTWSQVSGTATTPAMAV